MPFVSRPPTTTVFSVRAPAGSSHSNVTPTRSSPSPKAYTISVAEGSNDTTLTTDHRPTGIARHPPEKHSPHSRSSILIGHGGHGGDLIAFVTCEALQP